MLASAGSPSEKAQTPATNRLLATEASTASPSVPPATARDHSPKRRIWTVAEDEQLMSLVDEYGDMRWSQIAEKMYKRNHKQCRERWHNHLRPNLNKGEFTEKEDSDLLACVQQVGTCWAKIAGMIMPDRTDNDLKNRWNSIIRKPLHPSGRPWNQSEIEHRDAVFAKPKQSRRRPEPLTQVKRPRMLKVAPSTENSSYYPTVTISLRGEPVWWSDAVRSGELKWDPRAGIRSGQLKYDSQDSQEVLLPEELKYDLQNSIQSEELKDAAPLSVCIDGNQPGHPVLLPLVELQHELPVPIRAREPEREPLDALHSADFNYSVLDKAIRPSAEACVVPSRSDEVDIDTFNIGVDSSGLPDIEVEADADKVFADLLTDEELDSEDDDMSLEFALRTPQAQQPSSARDATRSAQKYSPQSMLMLRSLCGITPHEPIDAALEYSVAEDLREYADMNGVIEIEVEYDERTEHSTNSHQVLHSGVQLGRIALPHVSFATDP